MTTEEYKKKPREWKPESFNFRGNAENKAFVQSLVDKKDANKFSTEGEALDFIVQSFKLSIEQATEQSNPLTAKVAELENQLWEAQKAEKLAKHHLESIEKTLSERNAELTEARKNKNTYTCLETNETFQQLKKQVQEGLPKIFSELYPDVATEQMIPVTDDEVLSIACEYSLRDPSKQFPFQERTEPIVARFLETKKQANEKANEESTAGAGGGEATGQ